MLLELGKRAYDQLVDENAWSVYSRIGWYDHEEWLVEVWTQYSPFEFDL